MRARGRYLVMRIDSNGVRILKFSRSQLRSATYFIKRSDCFKSALRVAIIEIWSRLATTHFVICGDSKGGSTPRNSSNFFGTFV